MIEKDKETLKAYDCNSNLLVFKPLDPRFLSIFTHALHRLISRHPARVQPADRRRQRRLKGICVSARHACDRDVDRRCAVLRQAQRPRKVAQRHHRAVRACEADQHFGLCVQLNISGQTDAARSERHAGRQVR